MQPNAIVPIERIERAIHIIRNQKVILDADLAYLYGVETKELNRAVKRNRSRFPGDFMFKLGKMEVETLRCQNGTSKHGGRRYLPYAFTEQGVAMLSSVLNSERAIRVNIEIMRAFAAMRKMLVSHHELVKKVEAMERKYDARFAVVFKALKQLIMPPEVKKRPIGFRIEK